MADDRPDGYIDAARDAERRETYAEYRRYREQGLPARYAGEYATDRRPVDRPEWLAGLDIFDPVIGVVDGYGVKVRTEYDEYSMLGEDDVTGTFTDTPTETTVRNTTRYYSHGQNGQGYDYYEPPACLPEPPAGMSRGQADDFRREAIAQAMADDAGRSYHVVVVTVSRHGVELAQAAIGGVDILESNTATERHDYLAETAVDVIDMAMTDARATLAKLCRDDV